MSGQYQLKAGCTIYFMEVYFAETVHVMGGGIGFTDNLHTFAIGISPRDAERKTRKHYQAQGAKVSRVKGTPSSNQDINRYAFPEKMPGFECAILVPRSYGAQFAPSP